MCAYYNSFYHAVKALSYVTLACVLLRISYKGKKYVLLLSVEESFEDTFKSLTLRNNLYRA